MFHPSVLLIAPIGTAILLVLTIFSFVTSNILGGILGIISTLALGYAWYYQTKHPWRPK